MGNLMKFPQQATQIYDFGWIIYAEHKHSQSVDLVEILTYFQPNKVN